MSLVRARHEVFGVQEVPHTYLDLEEWTAVDPETPTAKESRRSEELADPAVAAVLPFDPAEHNLDGEDGVLAYLATADEPERARVIEAERSRGDKARATVLNWQPVE